MYGYIYKTTNLVNGKIYIGQHKSSQFNTNYYGSGKYLKNAINKYGQNNFTIEIIEECESKKDLNDREIYWISYYRKQKAQMYNIADGGEGGDLITCLPEFEYTKFCNHMSELNRHGVIGNKGKHLSEHHRKQIGLGNRGKVHSVEWKKKQGDAIRGKPAWNKGLTKEDERVQKHIHKKGEFHHSEATKQLLSKKLTGRKIIFTNPEERLENMRNAQRHRIRSPQESERARTIAVGRVWVNNGIVSKMIYPNELNDYLKFGYSLGRIYKRRKS